MAKEFKIVQFVNTLDTRDGGPSRYAFELFQELARIYPSSTLVNWSNDRRNQVYTAPPEGLVKVCLLSIMRIRHILLRRSDARRTVVIIHGYYLWWVPLVLFLIPKGVSTLCIPHGSLTAWQRNSHSQRKRLWDIVFARIYKAKISLFAVASQREKAELSAVFSQARVNVVGMGCNFSPALTSPKNSDGTAIKLLSLSRIAEKKRIDISIRSLACLVAHGSSASLTVVGTGSERLLRELKAAARELGVLDYVTFTGEAIKDEKWALYQSHDVYLLPSEDENFGVTVAEAAISGLPVITSQAVDSAKLLAGDGVYQLGDWNCREFIATVSKALKFATDPDRRMALINRTAAEVSWRVVAARLSELF